MWGNADARPSQVSRVRRAVEDERVHERVVGRDAGAGADDRKHVGEGHDRDVGEQVVLMHGHDLVVGEPVEGLEDAHLQGDVLGHRLDDEIGLGDRVLQVLVRDDPLQRVARLVRGQLGAVDRLLDARRGVAVAGAANGGKAPQLFGVLCRLKGRTLHRA